MLAVAGGKGGSGKTTTALGLAAALARDGQRPLVVDADTTMPNLHVLASVDPTPTTDDLGDGQSLARVTQRWPANPEVRIVAAGRRESLQSALHRLARWPGPTLVDCPAGASHDAVIPLAAADRTLLVTTDTSQALADTVKTEALARELGTPPAGALVRGDTTRAERYLGEMPVLTVREFAAGSILARPAFQTACESLGDVVSDATAQSSSRPAPKTAR